VSALDTTAQTTTIRELPFAVRFFQYFESLGVLAILLIVLTVTFVVAPAFFTPTNLTNLLITASIMAVTGFGMTIAIAMGGFDLSVGSVQALTAIAAASLLSIVSIPLAIVGALVVGLLVGILNGLLISKLRVPAFVTTLGMMSIIRGVALLYTKGQSVMIVGHDGYASLNIGKVLGIPVPLIIALIALGLTYILLQRTPFGRHVCAIGGNESAAIASGINLDVTTILVFGIVGVTAALSGVMLSSKLLIVDGTLGVGFELQAIAISVLGGTSLQGGNGNVLGTFFAALLLTVISSALNILKVESYYQYLALGLLLIFALSLDTLRHALISQVVRMRNVDGSNSAL
jgi:ribose/xylose/arabinose/galactoside ABC-type transport system permease subunit